MWLWTACTRLISDSVRRLFGRLVRRSLAECKNEPNWHNKTIWALKTISNDTASAWCCVYSIVTVPAQQHATKPSMYTALFYKQPLFLAEPGKEIEITTSELTTICVLIKNKVYLCNPCHNILATRISTFFLMHSSSTNSQSRNEFCVLMKISFYFDEFPYY